MWNFLYDAISLYQDIVTFSVFPQLKLHSLSDNALLLMFLSFIALMLNFAVYFFMIAGKQFLQVKIKQKFWFLAMGIGPFFTITIFSIFKIFSTVSNLNLNANVFIGSMSVFLGIIFYLAILKIALIAVFGMAAIPAVLVFVIISALKKRPPMYVSVGLVILTAVLYMGLLVKNGDEFFNSNPQASRYFPLHSVIKNTCLIDPKREHCPHTLEEISYVEPKEFAEANKSAQLIYQYDPATNNYVFIVRYSRDRAVIFDQRLKNEPDHNDQDFREVHIQTYGKDRIQEQPSYPGPWNDLPEWDK